MRLKAQDTKNSGNSHPAAAGRFPRGLLPNAAEAGLPAGFPGKSTICFRRRRTVTEKFVIFAKRQSNREELVRTAKELAAASLKDEGCVAYDLFESATRSDVLMICETWSNAKALAAHEQASHFTTLVPRLEQLGELKIEKFVF